MHEGTDPARRAGRRYRRGAGPALAAVALLALPSAAEAVTLRFAETIMTGLANPRGIAVAADGGVYVAESGSGGDGPTIISGSGEEQGYGLSGGISRYRAGVQERVVSELPSFAGPTGAEATGVQGLAFGADETLYGTVGLGANPAERAKIDGLQGANLVGTLTAFRSGGPEVIADIAGFEASDNPDGGLPDSNPFGVEVTAGGFVVTDAGGNSVISVDTAGAMATAGVLPPKPNPLFPDFGPPVYQAVPTGTALGADGSVYFGQLTGFPFLPGAAEVFELGAGGPNTVGTGFTNIIDVAFGKDGSLLVLELDSDSLLGAGTKGAIYALALDGTARLLFGDLERPTGLAVGADGSVYVAVNGFSPTEGGVVRLAPVPLPAAMPLLIGGIGLLAGFSFRRRRPAIG